MFATWLAYLLLVGFATATEWKFRSSTDGFAVVGGATPSAAGLQMGGHSAQAKSSAPPCSIMWAGKTATGDFTASLAFSGFKIHPPVRWYHSAGHKQQNTPM